MSSSPPDWLRRALLSVAAALAVAGCGLLEDPGADGAPADAAADGEEAGDGDADAFVVSTTVGASCFSDLDCQALLGFGATCLRGSAQADGVTVYYPDGYCSLTCGINLDGTDTCPPGSHCIAPRGAGFGFCGAACQSTRHCRAPAYCCVENAYSGLRVRAAPADPLAYCSL